MNPTIRNRRVFQHYLLIYLFTIFTFFHFVHFISSIIHYLFPFIRILFVHLFVCFNQSSNFAMRCPTFLSILLLLFFLLSPPPPPSPPPPSLSPPPLESSFVESLVFDHGSFASKADEKLRFKNPDASMVGLPRCRLSPLLPPPSPSPSLSPSPSPSPSSSLYKPV